MAKDKNILSSCLLKSYDYQFVHSNGEAIPAEISEKLSKLKSCMRIEEKTGEMRAYNGSLGNFYAKE